MVKVKELKDGQDAYLVSVDEGALYAGVIVKKPHEATLFVSNLGDIKVKVRDFEAILFTSAEKAEKFLFEEIDKSGSVEEPNIESKESENNIDFEDGDSDVDPRSSIILELEENEHLEEINSFVEKLNSEEVCCGVVITVVTYEGDVFYLPVYRNKKIGDVCASYDLAFASLTGFNDACECIACLFGIVS